MIDECVGVECVWWDVCEGCDDVVCGDKSENVCDVMVWNVCWGEGLFEIG